MHTHYDVQLDWEPTASPASWHGVTTVLTGNCGFTLAPAKPEDVDWLAQMLTRVEGMSARRAARGPPLVAAAASADYWRRVDGRIGVNVGSYVGHSAVRRYVMGDAGLRAPATPDEIAAMQELVRAAMREGAIGFSTSQLDIHVGDDGREVPSNHAAPEEIVALASVLAEFDRRRDRDHPAQLRRRATTTPTASCSYAIARASGRPVELNLLRPTPRTDGLAAHARLPREASRAAACACIRCSPSHELGAHLLADTFLFDEMPTWREALAGRRGARAPARRPRGPRRGWPRARRTPAGGAVRVRGPRGRVVRDGANRRVDGARRARARAPSAAATPLDAFLDCRSPRI